MVQGANSEASRRRSPIVCGPCDIERGSQTTPAARGILAHNAATALCMLIAAVVWLASLGPDASGQTNPNRSFWTGQLEVSVLRCAEECGPYELDNQGVVLHDPNSMVSRYTYNVYQNDKGVVRHDLISANAGGVNEQGRGAQIVDYARGYVLLFDQGASQAVRMPLVFPNTTSSALENRQLLGFKCSGVRTKWVQQRNQFRHVREAWTGSEIDFKGSLSSSLTTATMRGANLISCR